MAPSFESCYIAQKYLSVDSSCELKGVCYTLFCGHTHVENLLYVCVYYTEQ